MTVDEMIEAEKDPAHPRHEDVMEANRQMAEKFGASGKSVGHGVAG